MPSYLLAPQPRSFRPVPAGTATGVVRRKCAGCSAKPGGCTGCAAKDESRVLRRSADAAAALGAAVPSVVHDVVASPGRPLDPQTRDWFEPRFGRDFSAVRVHSDAAGAQSAGAVGAVAYTVGSHIVFAGGRYAPETAAGRRLLAHELAHVVQQSPGVARAGDDRTTGAATGLSLGDPAGPVEAEADRVADTVVAGRGPVEVHGQAAPGATVQRQLDPKKIYCALHAMVCIGLSENPPAAALCWANFVQRCSGAMAQNEAAAGSGGAAVAQGGGASAPAPA